MKIRTATPHDAAAVHAIYTPIVLATPISFEETVPPVAEMEQRIREKLSRKVSSKQNGEALPCRYIVLKKDVPELKA